MSDWTAGAATGFGEITPSDELFHGTGPAEDALTETWYWGFHVPEEQIACFAYCWVHPHLRVVTGGVVLYRGITAHHLASELFDMTAYGSLDAVGDGSRIRLTSGLQVDVLIPLEHVRLSFDDPQRDTSFDVELRAVSPPVVRANGLHFEQVVRATGRLRLRGQEHAVDGVHVRDRSWGELRPETRNPGAPYNWVTGASADGALAFNVGSVDAPTDGGTLRDGWLLVDGRPTRLAGAHKVITRDPATLRPVRMTLSATDEEGRALLVDGEVVASVPWSGWPNMVTHIALVRWVLPDGSVAWGESQDVQWNDGVRAGRAAGAIPAS